MARTNAPKILSTYNKTTSGTPRTVVKKTPEFTTTPVKKGVAPVKSAPSVGGKKVATTKPEFGVTPIKKEITPVRGVTSPVKGGSTLTPKVSRGTIKPIEGIPVPKNPKPVVKAASKK